MLKSCKYCGRIHEAATICEPRRVAEEQRKQRYNRSYKQGESRTKEDKFRSTSQWVRMREHILHRDRRLCLCCLAELKGTKAKYQTDDLSVHHITPIKEDYERRLDEGNLITVCRTHHEMCERGIIGRAKQYEILKQFQSGELR